MAPTNLQKECCFIIVTILGEVCDKIIEGCGYLLQIDAVTYPVVSQGLPPVLQPTEGGGSDRETPPWWWPFPGLPPV